MNHVHTTWYRLVDGTQADPNDVMTDDKGVLRHKNGVPVALRDSGDPVTVGARDVEDHGNAAAAKGGKAKQGSTTPPPATGAEGRPPKTVTVEEREKVDADKRRLEEDERKAADKSTPAGKDREIKAEGENTKKYETR